MKEPFEWYHNLYYGEKWNLSDYDTKNPKSLDYLLKQMFMKAHRLGKLKMKNSLPAFNAAYYVAVCLMNTEGIEESNLDEEIRTSIETICVQDYLRHHPQAVNVRCPYSERLLIQWMVYAILFLQEEHSPEMDEFLQKLREDLVSIEIDEDLMNSEEWDNYKFLEGLADMIEQWAFRYTTDLRPHALNPSCYNAAMWDNHVRDYSLNELKWQLTFFRTKEEQMAFLNWSKEQSCRPQPFIPSDDLPF